MNICKALKQILAKFFEFSREFWWYIQHILKRTTYAEYYAERMDKIVAKNPNWGLNLNRRFQLDYLVAHGLRPSSKLLDYGCGALSAGLHFVDYLESNCYTGVDISNHVLHEASARLNRAGLSHKNAKLHQLDRKLSSVIGNQSYDFIWAQSVFTHMPPEDISILLRDICQYMHEDTIFFASFGKIEGDSKQKNFKDWYHSREFFIKEAALCGLNVTFMPDWHHPDDHLGNDVMASFSLKEVKCVN